jgi:hypothetical protein
LAERRWWKPLVALVLVAFGAFNTYVALHEGYWSVFPPFRSLAQTQMFVDLAIALGLFDLWLIGDWKRSGRPMWVLVVFLLLPILVGSIGPLVYLLLRDDSPGRGLADRL